ncbi:hypothetical protein BK127_41810 [Paenibacillus sp. FSL H7-0331]|nr:hypothetical protein BK127_41810 [Paenibacillus sp. FSL H7-0331]
MLHLLFLLLLLLLAHLFQPPLQLLFDAVILHRLVAALHLDRLLGSKPDIHHQAVPQLEVAPLDLRIGHASQLEHCVESIRSPDAIPFRVKSAFGKLPATVIADAGYAAKKTTTI